MMLSCEAGVLPLVAMWLMPLTAPPDATWQMVVTSEEKTGSIERKVA